MIPSENNIIGGFAAILAEAGFTDTDYATPSEQGGWLRLTTSGTAPSQYDLQAIARRTAGLLLLNNYENVHKQSITMTDGRIEFKARVCKPQGATE